MRDLREIRPAPWYFAVVSTIVLLLAVGTVAVVGVWENTQLQDSSKRAIQFDLSVAAVGDDIRVAVLDLRYHHRNIVLSGPTDQILADFDEAYSSLLSHIAELEAIGVSDLAIPQPETFRDLATTYHDAFRPSIVLFTSDPVAFNTASNVGLGQIDQLEEMARQVDDFGERLTTDSLASIEQAARRERLILIALLGGVALIGALLLLATGRVLQRLQAANAAQEAASRDLETSLRMKTDFIADASHELRTPLTLIQGNAELGLRAPGTPVQADALTEIRNESIRMSRLVNDLLFLARIDAGSPPIEREYVPVRWLVGQVAKPAENLVRHHDLAFAAELDGEGYLVVDPARIEQAVLILVDNAIKFSPAGDTVRLKSDTRDGWLGIEVQDSGPGISPEDQIRIFDRFYQADNDGGRERGGAGLGLAIARSIVEAHGGTIGLNSKPGTGTTMRIRLPLV